MFGQTKPLGEAHDVRVNDDAFIDTKGVAEDDVRGLSRNAGKIEERVHVCGDRAAVKRVHDGHRAVHRLRFVAPEVDRLKERFDFFRRDCGVRFGRWEPFKQRGCRLVDALVGRLGGEDRRDEQLVRGGCVEFALCVWIALLERREHACSASSEHWIAIREIKGAFGSWASNGRRHVHDGVSVGGVVRPEAKPQTTMSPRTAAARMA